MSGASSVVSGAAAENTWLVRVSGSGSGAASAAAWAASTAAGDLGGDGVVVGFGQQAGFDKRRPEGRDRLRDAVGLDLFRGAVAALVVV